MKHIAHIPRPSGICLHPHSRTLRLTVMFSLATCLILSATMAATWGILLLLHRMDLIRSQSLHSVVPRIAIVSTVIGMVFARIIGSRTLTFLTRISDATREVARGNFTATLDEDIRTEELRTIAHNFNIMVQELQKTAVFSDDFIQNVSHEFKTPLSAIEGYATLLQNRSLTDEKRDLYVSKIIHNTRRLSTLTGNILQLSRLENQEITTEKESFSLDEQLREQILMFEESWRAKNLTLDIDLETVDYYGNYELLALVWQNLVGNAIKFSRQGGVLGIRLWQTRQQVSVSVSDDGIGMPVETMERVFEKFYQGDQAHATEGNGLGLTLARRIVVLHGGEIRLESQEGRGSTFTVLLPPG